MVKKKDIDTKIANLLPKGLDESVINSIAELLSEKIETEVEKVRASQTRKVLAFIRGNIDKLKEQALKELELENPTFRNAQLFETVKSLMAVELTGEDEISAINALASVSESQEEKMNVLVNELDRVLEENKKLKKSTKVLIDRNKLLESSTKTMSEELSSVSEKGKILSDKAVVVSAENFKLDNDRDDNSMTEQIKSTGNEWLSDDVMGALRLLN